MPGTSDVTQTDSTSGQQVLQKSTGNAAWVIPASILPAGATAVNAASGSVANAAAVATLPAVAGKMTCMTGFEITGTGATAAAVVLATVTGTTGGTLTYVYAAVAGATTLNQPLIVQFTVPLQASAVNTAITVTLPALGPGNTNAAVVAHGYQL